MIKTILFQLHWFLGISAGLILSIMGLTGALFSYEQQIIHTISPHSFEVEAQDRPTLNPAALYHLIHTQYPSKTIKTLTVASAPTQAASVTFDNGSKHGETRTVNPYTAQLLPKANGEEFFDLVENIHRFLALGEFAKLWSDGSDNQPEQWRNFGKQLTGISAIALIYFVLSGIYLRWPRKSSFKEWLVVKKNLKGRSFLWNLHAVVGTWVLIFFLLLTLTGLTWSYNWYRNAAYAVMGVEAPKPKAKPQPATQSMPKRDGNKVVSTQRSTPNTNNSAKESASIPINTLLEASWVAFNKQVNSYSTAAFKIPEKGNTLEVSFVDAIAQHERARNSFKYNGLTQQIEELSFYKDKPLNEKIMSSLLPVHRGSFFGPIWQFLTMLAALSMPLFFITGWMLYLKRRKQKKITKNMQQLAPRPFAHASKFNGDHQGHAELSNQTPWLIIYASQTGFAEQIAWRTAQSLHQAEIATQVIPIHQLNVAQLHSAKKALFVVSTYGQGQAPDHARPFAKKQLKQPLDLSGLDYAVLALGDQEYQDTYCTFGQQVEAWLTTSGANALFDIVRVNNGNTHDIARWTDALSSITQSNLQAMSAERIFDDWYISQRNLLNPHSLGAPAFELRLTAKHDAVWHAGDIAEIQCGNNDTEIEQFISHHQLDAHTVVQQKNGSRQLFDALRYLNLRLDNAERFNNCDAQHCIDLLSPLPVREYSIASIPSDGYLSLVVRQQWHGDVLGLGSGWLTLHAPLNQPIAVRIRTNDNFRAPDDNRPVILIGNGTGIAGLLSILKNRQQHGFHQNWLIFGERQQQHDFFFAEQIQRWVREQHIQRLDLAFSRDQAERVYVQQRLAAQPDQLKQWVEQGASIYVCGSIEGMAPAVDQVLSDILGDTMMEKLIIEERYRRDVY